MNKFIILILLSLLFISMTNAGYYQINKVIDFNDNVNISDNTKLGEIILTRTITNTTSYLLNNFTTLNIQLGDKVINNVNEVVKVNNTNKNQGEVFDFFNKVGSYDVKGLTTNQTTTIIVSDLSSPLINISFINLNFDYYLTKNNFHITQDEIIDFNLSIPDNSPPTTHNIFLQLIIDNQTQPVNSITFKIKELRLWELDYVKLVDKIDAGETGIAGNLSLENIGNDASNINISFSGNISNVLSLPQKTIVFPSAKTVLQILYNLGAGIKTGTYKGNLILEGEGLKDEINLSIIVEDIILPEIVEYKFPESVMAQIISQIEIKVVDNTGVKNVFLTPILNDGGKYVKQNKIGFTKGSGTDWYNTDLYLEKPGDYILEVEMIDLDNNINYRNFSMLTTLQDIVFYKPYYKLLTIKYDKWSVLEDFIYINQTIPISILLNSMYYGGNYTLALQLPNGELRYLQSNIPTIISQAGKYQLQFKGDKTGDYNGIIKLATDTPHKPFEDITFSGEVGNFSVPAPYSTEWYGGKLECTINDGGNPETSETVCMLKYKGYVDIKEQALPVTTELKINKEEEFNARIEEENKKIFKKNFIIFLLILTVISVLSLQYYLVKIRPYLYLKWR